MKAEDIEEARKTLGLRETSTLKEVKEAYRNLAKIHHPDKNGNAETMNEVSNAYNMIMQYIENYRYSFSQKEVRMQNPEIIWAEMVENDPLWGRGKQDKNGGI